MKNRIKELRTNKKLTQKELGDICGVSRQTINMIENNKYDPTLQLAMKIARTLEISVEELFILEA